MPIEAVEGYRYPVEGTARLYMPGQEPDVEEPEVGESDVEESKVEDPDGEAPKFYECDYRIDRNFGHVNFTTGWTNFRDVVDLGWAALLLIKIAPIQDLMTGKMGAGKKSASAS